MSMARPWWLLWSAGMVGVLAALGYQASYAAAIADCVMGAQDALALCAGPLPAWLTPATLAGGLILTGVATWRLQATD